LTTTKLGWLFSSLSLNLFRRKIMEVTKALAEFAASLRYDRIPGAALTEAKKAARDCIGVALAGSKEEDAKICAGIARQEGAREEATVYGQRLATSAMHAAFANGTAAHAMDFDHSFTLTGQPTAPILPAAFALGEALGASGRQVLEAYAAGFETTAKLVFSIREASQDGWHAPSILGVFGASVACAKLLGLNAAEIQMALGIASSMASGVVANFGTMTKPLHVGLSARNGVTAAKLAQSGFTANARAIEAGVGFYENFYHGAPIDTRPIEELGKVFALETDGIRIKPYPCGGLTHPTIDAMFELCAKHGISADMIESVDAAVTKHTYNRIAFKVPQTGIQGKFCMPYLLARAIVDKKIGLDVFTDEAVRDPSILKLAERIEMHLDTSLKADGPGGRPCRVTVHLKNGQSYSCEKQHAKGSPEAPMTQDELRAKFTECARLALDRDAAERARESIESLETLNDIRPLCQLLRG
jgi:2-methylcitrate dehydratase PrpD